MSDLAHSNPSSPAEPKSASEKEFVYLLISLYRDLPALWKVESKDYRNKKKRRLAIKKMLDVLQTVKPDFDEEKLKKKINVLRTNFNKEHKKIEKIRKSGAYGDDIIEPTLWYYSDFLFIKDQPGMSDTDSFTHRSPSQSPVPVKRIKAASDSKEKVLDVVTRYLKDFKKPESEMEIVARGWASKLNRIAPDQRCFAEKIINDIIFEAEMGTLTRERVCF